MTLGPQFHDSFGPEPVRLNAIALVNKRAAMKAPESYLVKDEAQKVFNAVNIRNWPLEDAPSSMRWPTGGKGEDSGYRDADEVLHTSQGFLDARAVQKYMRGEVPEFDPDFDTEEGGSDVPYLPEIVSTEAGTPWINEGHHRLVSSRLLGRGSKTWEYGMEKPPS